mgnify:CR=1 FL=1
MKDIKIKTKREIELMRKAGAFLKSVMDFLVSETKAGMRKIDLDKLADEKIRSLDCKPGFLGYRGFPKTLIVCKNDEIVHGIPNEDILNEGDLVTFDLGLIYKGFYSDKAVSFVLGGGEKNKLARDLIKRTEEAFFSALEFCKEGFILNDISKAIEKVAKKYNLGIVKETTGHGIGKKLHEDPLIFNFSNFDSSDELKEGMVFAIEPIFTLGSPKFRQKDDGWTLVTEDGSISAHYENTVLIKKNGYEVLTL